MQYGDNRRATRDLRSVAVLVLLRGCCQDCIINATSALGAWYIVLRETASGLTSCIFIMNAVDIFVFVFVIVNQCVDSNIAMSNDVHLLVKLQYHVSTSGFFCQAHDDGAPGGPRHSGVAKPGCVDPLAVAAASPGVS